MGVCDERRKQLETWRLMILMMTENSTLAQEVCAYFLFPFIFASRLQACWLVLPTIEVGILPSNFWALHQLSLEISPRSICVIPIYKAFLTLVTMTSQLFIILCFSVLLLRNFSLILKS